MEKFCGRLLSLFAVLRANALGAFRNLQARDPANFVRLRPVANPDTDRVAGADSVGGLISSDESGHRPGGGPSGFHRQEAFSKVPGPAQSPKCRNMPVA